MANYSLSLSLSRKPLTFSLENKQLNKPQKSHGFTIVELLVVIVVIGILAAITIVSYTGITQKANIAAIQSDLVSVSQRLKMYYTLYSSYPTSLDGNNCPTAPTADTNYCIKLTGTNTLSYNGSTNQFSAVEANSNSTNYYKVTDSTAPTATNSLDSGLVGYWKFDEGSGTVLNDTSNDGITGAISGITAWPAGKSGTALTFDGTTTYVNFGRNTKFNLTTFSVAFWYRVPVIPNTNYQDIYNFSNVSNTKFDSGGNLWAQTPGRTMGVHAPAINTWYYIVLTNDGSNYMAYLNGALSQNWTCSPGSWNSSFDSYLGGAGQFRGDIDNLRLYNRVVSSAEASTLYNSLQ